MDKEILVKMFDLLLSSQIEGKEDDVVTTLSWKIGQAYLIRTVTNYWTGRLVLVCDQELVLEDAAWIADTGRFSLATQPDALSEVEPRNGPVIVGRGSIVDAVQWDSDLPRTQK